MPVLPLPTLFLLTIMMVFWSAWFTALFYFLTVTFSKFAFMFILKSFRGHGTLDVDGEVIATVCGVVERINKLVYVRTLRARWAQDDTLASLCGNPEMRFLLFCSVCYMIIAFTCIVHRYKPEVGDIVVGRVIEVLRISIFVIVVRH